MTDEIEANQLREKNQHSAKLTVVSKKGILCLYKNYQSDAKWLLGITGPV